MKRLTRCRARTDHGSHTRKTNACQSSRRYPLTFRRRTPPLPGRPPEPTTAAQDALLVDFSGLLEAAAAQLRAGREPALRAAGLGDAEFRLLCQLREAAGTVGVSQIELAREIGISTAQTSTLVEKLRRAGLVEGHRPAHDRRRQVWQLTERGRTVLADLEQPLGAVSSQFVDDHRPTLIALQQQLSQLLAEEVAAPGILSAAETAAAPPLKRGAA